MEVLGKIRIFFDTNVLVYAHDELSPFHPKSAELIDLALEGKIQGIISEQNLMELYKILTNPSAMRNKPLTPTEVKELIERTYLSGEFELIYPTKEILYKTITLAEERNANSAKIFDLRLSAQALSANVAYFATYNTNDFGGIKGLLPKTPEEILLEAI